METRALKQFLLFGLRTCLNCGDFNPNESRFCHLCEVKIFERSLANINMLTYRQGLPIFRLFDWNPGESDTFSSLVESLKGKYSQNEWLFYGSKLVLALETNVLQGDSQIIVPSPAIPSGRRHALYFAQGISNATGIKHMDCLEFIKHEPQRNLNKMERGKRRLKCKPDLDQQHLAKKIIFVDDIVTTGFTALAARKAFPNCENFIVLTLACRN